MQFAEDERVIPICRVTFAISIVSGIVHVRHSRCRRQTGEYHLLEEAGDELQAAFGAGIVEDVAQVRLDGMLAYRKRCCDLAVRPAAQHQGTDRLLTWAQSPP